MSGLGLVAAAWICWISYRNRCTGQLLLHLLSLLKPWLIKEMCLARVLFKGDTFVDVPLNWLNWFRSLIFVGGLLIFQTIWMLLLSPVTARPQNSFSTECFPLIYDLNVFKSILIDTFNLCQQLFLLAFNHHLLLSCMRLIIFFLFFL